MSDHRNSKTAPNGTSLPSSQEQQQQQQEEPVPSSSNDNNNNNDSNNRKILLLRIAVGSENPCKIDAVKQALQGAIGLSSSLDFEFDIQGFSVPSGVPDQPFGDEETQWGAKQRAEAAHKAYKEANKTYPHLAIGLEGGLEWSSTIVDEEDDDTLWCMAWIAVYGRRQASIIDLIASSDTQYYTGDKKPILGVAKTSTFLLPKGVTKLVKQGMELGKADDLIFGRTKSGQGSGTVGLLTNHLIDRRNYYAHAVTLALIPWIRPDLYNIGAGGPNGSDTGGGGLTSRLFCKSGR